MYIYLASSWRNKYHKWVIEELRANKFSVYDFKKPDNLNRGFNWSDIDKKWKSWSNSEYIKNLNHSIAINGYNKDMNSLFISDVVILLMPCGRSAHLEMGYGVGKNKKTAILVLDESEPELMYKMVNKIFTNLSELLKWLEGLKYLESMGNKID